MSGLVRREERRLQRIFQRALLLALAAPAACTSGEAQPDPEPQPGAPEASGTGGSGGATPVVGSDFTDELEALPDATLKSCAPVPFTPNPPDKCGNYVRLPCGLPAGVTPGSNCYLWLNDCQKVCPGAYFNCHAVDDSCKDGNIVKDAKGGINIDCATCAKGVGRIPAGLAPATMKPAPSPLGDYFASVAHLEAAAVHAFDQLHQELAASGAPAPLLQAARRARRDELRHVRLTARLARRFGGKPAPARVTKTPSRPFAAIALENAVEGCIRETFGALIATFQAQNAKDPEIAEAMHTIARDETRHAALSWAIAHWAAENLSPEARHQIANHCRQAIESLRREPAAPTELVTRAGLPDGPTQRALVDALEQELWGYWATESS
jgi:hypothetical protein